jgi:hypothetical protein
MYKERSGKIGDLADIALGALHPVDNAFVIFEWHPGTADGDMWVVGEVLQEKRGFRLGRSGCHAPRKPATTNPRLG